MTFTDWSGVPEGVAAARAEIEAEIAGSTLLTEFAETAAEAPDKVAHQWQADGEWRSLTYRQLYDLVRDAALGLAAAGLRPGEFAAVWSRNRSEATIADYAVMHAGGVPVFIYPTVAPGQAADIIGHCEATVVVVEREFLPVLESIEDRLPQLRAVVVLGDDMARDVTLDAGTLGPAIDTTMATSAPGVFAAGNLVHAAETADVAAMSGRHAARQIAAYLAGASSLAAAPSRVPVVAEPPLRWISPNAIGADSAAVLPPLGRFAIRPAEFRQRARLEAWQDGRLLARSRPLPLIPGRPVHLHAAWVTSVDPGGGPVRVGTG